MTSEPNSDEEESAMSRIADEQRGSGQSRSDERLAERRAALRRAVSDLGDVTSRFRTRLADAGHDVPPPPARNGATHAAADRPATAHRPPAAPSPLLPATPPGSEFAAPPLKEPMLGPTQARDNAVAEARMRFEAASRQADELVRTISEAVRNETAAFHANIEAGAETRFREIEVEAQRRMRRAEAEADALVEQRRRRIAEVSDRILELGETLAGRLTDADQVKGQFDLFVQALGQASDRLARDGAQAPAEPVAMPMGKLSPSQTDSTDAGLAEAA